jgi:putative ABC transport system permease protein
MSQAGEGRFADLPVMLRLATADWLHEGRLSLCLVLALAAVLVPLLVLLGLKSGLIAALARDLANEPSFRELRPLGQGRFDTSFLAELGARPEVAFLMPSTRFLAATVSLVNPSRPDAEPVQAELVPTASGDPLLGAITLPDPLGDLVLSAPAAEQLGLHAGGQAAARFGRVLASGTGEVLKREMRVIAVLPPMATPRVQAFVSLPFLVAVEDYRDGRSVSSLGVSTGDPPPEGARRFASFRLFARTIFDVAPLRAWLAAHAVRVDARLAEIQLLTDLDRSLSILYAVVAGLGGAGYVLCLAVSLWAAVERKRRHLAVLRLLGLRSASLAILPAAQAAMTALSGAVTAVIVCLLTEQGINRLFASGLPGGRVVSALLPQHLVVAVLATLVIALLASIAASVAATRVMPAEGLRDE